MYPQRMVIKHYVAAVYLSELDVHEQYFNS